MAKTTNPIHSLDASGSLQDLLTFSSSKGRTYVKKWAAPKNPNTNDQIRTRVAMAFGSKLAKDWPDLIDPRYKDEAQNKGTTTRSLYIANVTRGFAGGVVEDPAGNIISLIQPTSTIQGYKEVQANSVRWYWTYGFPEAVYGWLVSIRTAQSETTVVKNTTAATGLAMEFIQKDGVPGQVYYMRAIALLNTKRFQRQNIVASVIYPG